MGLAWNAESVGRMLVGARADVFEEKRPEKML